MLVNKKTAQSIIEYVVLFSLIICSIIIMQVYVKRAYQGKLRAEADQLGPLYSPGHTTSSSVTDIVATHRTTSPQPGVTKTETNTNTTVNFHERVDALAAD